MQPPCANRAAPPPDPPAAPAAARTIFDASMPDSGPAYATILTVLPSLNTPQYVAPGSAATSLFPNSMWNVSPRPSPPATHARRPPLARTSIPSSADASPSATAIAASSMPGTRSLSDCRAAALALSRSALASSAASASASALFRSPSSPAPPLPPAAPGPVMNSSRTTPSCMRLALVIRRAPTWPVRPTCVPPHASESILPIETMRTELTGTTPPWYMRNPYSRSAAPLSRLRIVTAWSARMIALASSCMRPTSSGVSGEWCVTSSLAWSSSLNAECCHTQEPRTERADALSMCVPVWFLAMACRLLASTAQRTIPPLPHPLTSSYPGRRAAVPHRLVSSSARDPAFPSTVCTTMPPCLATSVTRSPPTVPRSGSCPPPLA